MVRKSLIRNLGITLRLKLHKRSWNRPRFTLSIFSSKLVDFWGEFLELVACPFYRVDATAVVGYGSVGGPLTRGNPLCGYGTVDIGWRFVVEGS